VTLQAQRRGKATAASSSARTRRSSAVVFDSGSAATGSPSAPAISRGLAQVPLLPDEHGQEVI
jgi:hypothetical protein